VLGSHNGPRVTPGRYTLRLSSSEDLGAPEAEALVVPDPRIEADEQDYEAQQEALDSIREMAAELHSEVNRFAQVKAQLSGKLKLLKNMEEHTELVQLAQAASEQLKAWESQLIQRRQKTQQDVVNFPNRLNAQLLYLAGELDTNSPLPTQASLQRLADLSNQWEELRVQLDKLIQGSIADFNTRYKLSGLPAVIIPDRIESP
ncbi:MAG: glycosyl hydrolase, partial [Planctomycetota bacterium]|nr:glycosyl hydrolase [Planctomycetota bacterium]